MRQTFRHDQQRMVSLATPTDVTFVSAIQMWRIYFSISKDPSAFNSFLDMEDPRVGFGNLCEQVVSRHDSAETLLNQKCAVGQIFEDIFKKIAVVFFNLFSKDFLVKKVDSIRSKAKRTGNEDQNLRKTVS